MKIVIPPKTLVRGKPLFFFYPLSYCHRCRTTCHSANRYGTLSIYFCFFLFPLFFLPVVVDCEFNLSQGLRRAETGNCGVLPNRIVNPTNRTGDDGSGGGGERDCYQALTDAHHALYRSCTPPLAQSYHFTFVHNNIFHFEIFQGSDNYLG